MAQEKTGDAAMGHVGSLIALRVRRVEVVDQIRRLDAEPSGFTLFIFKQNLVVFDLVWNFNGSCILNTVCSACGSSSERRLPPSYTSWGDRGGTGPSA